MESKKKKKTLSVKEILNNAINNQNLEQIKKVISSGNVDINQKIDKYSMCSLLYRACVRGYDDIVEFLLKQPSIDVNLCNPLWVVAIFGEYPILAMLLGHKNINVNAKLITTNLTPICGAAKEARPEVVKLLIRHGAIVDDYEIGYLNRYYVLNKEILLILNNWKLYLPEWTSKTNRFFPKKNQRASFLFMVYIQSFE